VPSIRDGQLSCRRSATSPPHSPQQVHISAPPSRFCHRHTPWKQAQGQGLGQGSSGNPLGRTSTRVASSSFRTNPRTAQPVSLGQGEISIVMFTLSLHRRRARPCVGVRACDPWWRRRPRYPAGPWTEASLSAHTRLVVTAKHRCSGRKNLSKIVPESCVCPPPLGIVSDLRLI